MTPRKMIPRRMILIRSQVKTGDATDVIPFFGMTVLAAGAAIVIALKKKRRA